MNLNELDEFEKPKKSNSLKIQITIYAIILIVTVGLFVFVNIFAGLCGVVVMLSLNQFYKSKFKSKSNFRTKRRKEEE